LNTFTVKIPPLRERPEDIFELANVFLKYFNREYGTNRRISPEALLHLKKYAFPGNVRELKNMIKMALVMCESDLLDPAAFALPSSSLPSTALARQQLRGGLADDLDALERTILKNAAANCRTTREMAALLQINQSTVVRKLKKHGLTKIDA
jgi:DNA-binding NtrC family response regulator